ncbi:hypothetical protein KP509_05G094000 [Ceratopteris richardii]|nr:hypothetical protein KP509_05G094000 [Ceratopteris richardii]
MYLGFSATTAPADRGMEGHVIYAWSFNNGFANSPSKRPTFRYILVASVLGMILCILVILYYIYMVKHRQNKSKHAHAARIEDALRSARPFSYRELERATNGFNEAMKVGEGGYGAVYKGVLRDGSIVAVKKLRMSTMLEDQFYAEARIIKKARHRYLLELQGWCYEEGQAALLVSQYMSRGSLDRYLFDGIRKRELGSSVMMQKETRIRILTQVAAALEYLHGGLGDCVLHRDVKAANVLLTEGEKMEARLGDFGLAKLISRDVGIVLMSAAGTPGYVAPEVLFNGMATEKADVYSFGVLTLEVVSGRRTISAISTPSDSEPGLAHLHLPYWLWSTLDLGGGIISDEQLCNVLDPILLPSLPQAEPASDYDHHLDGGGDRDFWDDWRCIVHLGLICCHPLPQCRPTMKEVSRAFDQRILLPLPLDSPCSLYPFPIHPEITSLGNIGHHSVSTIIPGAAITSSFSSSTNVTCPTPLLLSAAR